MTPMVGLLAFKVRTLIIVSKRVKSFGADPNPRGNRSKAPLTRTSWPPWMAIWRRAARRTFQQVAFNSMGPTGGNMPVFSGRDMFMYVGPRLHCVRE
jgi:hypothetical protein